MVIKAFRILIGYIATTYNELLRLFGRAHVCKYPAMDMAELISWTWPSDDDIVMAWAEFEDEWSMAKDFGVRARELDGLLKKHRPHLMVRCTRAPAPPPLVTRGQRQRP